MTEDVSKAHWNMRNKYGERIDDNYLYLFENDASICIILNPTVHGLRLIKDVDYLIKDEFKPLDF